MQQDITMGAYLEWGEHNGNFYGKKIDTVRDVINSGKICVLDCDPSVRICFVLLFFFIMIYKFTCNRRNS